MMAFEGALLSVVREDVSHMLIEPLQIVPD
jgi:hypothetical protein